MSNLCHDLRDIANEHSLELTDHARHSLEEAASLLFSQTSQIAALSAVKDNAYSERNKLVAALAAIYPSGIAPTAIEGWEPEWHGCVYIDLPTGQASWHYHDSEAHLFAHLRPYAGSWDGHSTEEKYQRLAALVALPNVQAKGTEDQKTWCGYVAGLIGTYLGWGEHDAHLEEAVAGIIERRLWALAPRAQAPAPAQPEIGPDSENYAGDEAPLPADVPYPPSLDNVTIYNPYGPMSMDPTDGHPVQAYWDRAGLRDYGARCIAWAAAQAPAPGAGAGPLTDEQIVRIYERPDLAGTRHASGTEKAIAIARAIEAAHGIKEQA